MRGLAVTQENLANQQGVVTNEVQVNVLNRPYGGFPWLDMPQVANENWYNAHNFYGDLADLEAATLDDVQAFFETYYAPNNAVLALVGDFDPTVALAWVKQHFGDIPAGAASRLGRTSPSLARRRRSASRRSIRSRRGPRSRSPGTRRRGTLPSTRRSCSSTRSSSRDGTRRCTRSSCRRRGSPATCRAA